MTRAAQRLKSLWIALTPNALLCSFSFTYDSNDETKKYRLE
jgi:hypothetical protein